MMITSDFVSDEHYRRSPGCPFFVLSSQPKPKAPRKTARASKASRLSTQSSATLASEAPETTFAETTFATAQGNSTIQPDDTVLTTTSTMTAGGTKKGRAKKTTAAKGRKTKAKKEEPEPEPEPEVDEVKGSDWEPEAGLEPSPVAPHPKKRAARGKKRGSPAIDESTMTATSEAPTRKKRATRKGSVAVESSVLEPTATEDLEMADVPAPKKANIRQKRAPSKAKNTRKASGKMDTSIISAASAHEFPGAFPSDDEIERQLEAELEHQLTDDEDITADSDSERRKKANAKTKGTKPKKAAEKKSADYAMFDPVPAEPVEEDIDDELNALREEMQVDEHQPEPEHHHSPKPEQELKVPKKGRKAAAPRKVSKQTKAKKAKVPEPEVIEVVPEAEEPEVPAVRDVSWGSTDTVVKKSEQDQERLSMQSKPRSRLSVVSHAESEDELADDPVELVEPSPPAPMEKKKGGRPSKASSDVAEKMEKSVEFVDVPGSAVHEPKKKRGRPSKASQSSQSSQRIESVEPAHASSDVDDPPPPKRGRGRPSKQAQALAQAQEKGAAAPQPKAADAPVKRPRGRPPKKSSVESKLAEAEAQAQLQQEELDAEARADEYSVHEDDGPEIFEEPQLSPVKESPVAPSSVFSEQYAQPPSTPGHGPSPSASARQAVISPSQSPQSSDAENQPPSSRPSASVTTKRVALAPISATPVRNNSPSKRNIMAKLQSTRTWKSVDLDAVFGSPDKENAGTVLRKGKELTSPEKRMTVEEWVYHNAGEAERILKEECEGMVSKFESEGGKAMSVLEGLMIE